MVIKKYQQSTEFHRFPDKVNSASHYTTNSITNHGGIRTPHLIDKYGRILNYLRLAVTDRCNLRCEYCMPRNKLISPTRGQLLSWDELIRLCGIFIELGINKIRITGGEPFVRRGLLDFLTQLKTLKPVLDVGITTNGVLVNDYLDDLYNIGISHLNFSLDSLADETFRTITGKPFLERVITNINKACDIGFKVKINTVVLAGINDHEIPDFVDWTRTNDITVRFIEPMPFDTYGGRFSQPISGQEILNIVRNKYNIKVLRVKTNSVTHQLFRAQGFLGKIGIINGFTRNFCHRCSRLRMSGQGQMRTCLYGKPILDLRALLHNNISDDHIKRLVQFHVSHRQRDGFEAAKANSGKQFESMSLIGG